MHFIKENDIKPILTSRASTVFKYINMTVFKLSPPKNYLFMNWETLKFTFFSDNKKEIKKWPISVHSQSLNGKFFIHVSSSSSWYASFPFKSTEPSSLASIVWPLNYQKKREKKKKREASNRIDWICHIFYSYSNWGIKLLLYYIYIYTPNLSWWVGLNSCPG